MIFFYVIDVHLLFACLTEYLYRSKFASDSICFRPLALKWNLVNCFARVTIYSRDIDHSFFLSALCTNWYTRFRRMSRKRNPQSPSIVTKRVNQNEARGKSHGRKASSIALCIVDERHSELLKKKKKKKSGENTSANAGCTLRFGDDDDNEGARMYRESLHAMHYSHAPGGR